MDKASLVREDIEAGRKFVTFLKENGLPIALAGWLKPEGESNLKLYIATPDVQTHGPLAVYAFIDKALSQFGRTWFDLDNIVAANTTNHYVNGITSAIGIVNSDVTMTNCEFFGVPVEYAVMYESHVNVKPSKTLPKFRRMAPARKRVTA